MFRGRLYSPRTGPTGHYHFEGSFREQMQTYWLKEMLCLGNNRLIGLLSPGRTLDVLGIQMYICLVTACHHIKDAVRSGGGYEKEIKIDVYTALIRLSAGHDRETQYKIP